MILRSRLGQPKTLLRIAMAALVVALLVNRFLRPSPYLSEDLADAIRGFFFGIAIALEIMFVIVFRRRTCA